MKLSLRTGIVVKGTFADNQLRNTDTLTQLVILNLSFTKKKNQKSDRK